MQIAQLKILFSYEYCMHPTFFSARKMVYLPVGQILISTTIPSTGRLPHVSFCVIGSLIRSRRYLPLTNQRCCLLRLHKTFQWKRAKKKTSSISFETTCGEEYWQFSVIYMTNIISTAECHFPSPRLTKLMVHVRWHFHRLMIKTVTIRRGIMNVAMLHNVCFVILQFLVQTLACQRVYITLIEP